MQIGKYEDMGMKYHEKDENQDMHDNGIAFINNILAVRFHTTLSNSNSSY